MYAYFGSSLFPARLQIQTPGLIHTASGSVEDHLLQSSLQPQQPYPISSGSNRSSPPTFLPIVLCDPALEALTPAGIPSESAGHSC